MTTLPFLKIAKQKIELPDSKKKIEIRPYLTGEEKALLMAIESKEPDKMQYAIRNLVSACIETKNVDISKVSMIDLEYIFIQLRIISVNAIVELELPHKDITKCGHMQKVQLDLNKMKIEGVTNKKVVIDEEAGIGLVMKSPTIETIESLENSSNVQKTFDMISACVDYVYDKENVYKDFTIEEIDEWINRLTEKQLEKIIAFFDNLPKIVYSLDWQCEKCGEVEHRDYEGILNFL